MDTDAGELHGVGFIRNLSQRQVYSFETDSQHLLDLSAHQGLSLTISVKSSLWASEFIIYSNIKKNSCPLTFHSGFHPGTSHSLFDCLIPDVFVFLFHCVYSVSSFSSVKGVLSFASYV